MAFVPISGIVPQATENGNQASGMVLKFYEPGTLTPLAVGIDSTGATQTTEFLLDIQGYTTLSGNKEIPHVDQIYKIALYLDQADADANDTGSAVYVIDDIDQRADLQEDLQADIDSNSLRPLDSLKADNNIAVGDFVESSEYITGSGKGSGLYKKVIANPGSNLMNPPTADSNFLLLIRDAETNAYHSGAAIDGVTDDTVNLQEYADYLSSFVNGVNLDTTNKPIFYIPPADGAVITTQLNIPFGVSVIMDAPILVQAAAGATSPNGWVRIGEPPNGTTRGRNLKFVIDVRRLTLSDWVSEDDLGCWLDTVQAAEVWLRRFDNFTIGCRVGGAYSEIRLGEFRDNQIGMWYTNQANSFSTTTQFYGGEFAVINGSNNGINRYGIRFDQSVVNSMNSVVLDGQSFELSQTGAGAAEAVPYLISDFQQLSARNQRTEGNNDATFARLTNDCRWCRFQILNMFNIMQQETRLDDQSTYKIGNNLSFHSSINHENSYLIFDSGRLADKTVAYDANTENIAGLEGINNTSPATFKRNVSVTSVDYDRGSIVLGAGITSAMGVRINTRNCKKIGVVLDQDQANGTNAIIVAFDDAGTQLGTLNTTVLTNRSTPTVTANAGVAGGSYLLTGVLEPIENEHVFTFADDVADVYIGVYDGTFTSYKIYGLEGSAESYIGDSSSFGDTHNVAQQIPTSGTYEVGKFILNEVPAAASTKFVCTVAGTPGTWITE